MDIQTKITLTSLNGGVGPAQRTFVLTTDCRSISVGRASKSASKGLLGAEDNAWFDSPVMSRNHASISFDPNVKAIMIEDIGSMHGTFLNNVHVPAKVITVVQNEDEVKFGAEVRRGQETFPACRFRLSYDIVPCKSTASYKFPDYSDLEDEEEEEGLQFSDEVGRASSEDDHSIESPRSKAVSSDSPIDLTREDSPIRSNLVDLTDDTPADTPAEIPAEYPLVSVLTGRPVNVSGSTSYSNFVVYAGNSMAVDDASDDEDAHFSTDSEDQAEDDDSSGSGSSSVEYGLDEVLDEILDDDANDEAEGSDDEYPAESIMEDDEDDVNQDSESDLSLANATATNDYTVVRLSEPLSADESSADEEDDESDFGLSEAGEEGLEAHRDSGLLQSPPQDISSQAPYALQATQTAAETPGGSAYVSFRQPSPSDAAMVKSQISTLAPIPASAQSIGSAFGKSEFFAAREINKSRFFPHEIGGSAYQPEVATVAASKTDDGARLYEAPDFSFGRRQAQQVQAQALHQSRVQRGLNDKAAYSAFTSASSSNNSNATQSTSLAFADSVMPHRDECAFLDRPSMTPMPRGVAIPLPDMTSAATYSAAKDLAAKSIPKASSVLKIQDLCSDQLPPQTNLKRKAQDISDDANEELRTWGNGTSHSLQHSPITTVVSNTESPVAPGIDGPRPAKRFRQFLEKAGYVAIGGVAVGSALFTALIATAPDFV